eukprot:TRINITY_DN2175_c0_g2_i1.p2 TRINITY_DN2175_c0_g2~~TRINITY_DN2175_c0_g2_i1.p2  ORF type:complete len:119 (+),score=16.90 TRINITY_DN2175_c0_g2_i1:124-480(+)
MDTGAFVNAMEDKLEQNGGKAKLLANVRSEVFKAVTETEAKPPSLNGSNVIINELIREYLAYNEYRHTEDVLITESGQPRERLQREFVADELNLDDTTETRQLPLLYGIVNLLKLGPS